MRRASPKLKAASDWLRHHPDADQSLAVKRGFSKATFYKAKRELKGKLVLRQPTEKQAMHPLVHLILEMEEKLGLVEFHYKDGTLEILQRRKVKVRDGSEE